MVDPIGNKAGAIAARRVASVSTAGPTTAIPPVAAPRPALESKAAELASGMAAQAPVDVERAAKIRKAIAEGRFPISPATVADRLLALKLDWKPNDPA